MNKIKAIVIDDEFYNRDLIAQMITSSHLGFDIIGAAEDVESGYDLINKSKPDVVFLDIKMPDGTGFDLLQKISNPQFEVVFITGFDQYAIQAFDYNALDYILKPIDTQKLKKTLDKVEGRFIAKNSMAQKLKEVINTFDKNDFVISKIPIHVLDQVILLDLKDVVSIQADSGYTIFKSLKNEKYISSKQMSGYEFIIEKYSTFIKISKSVYVNLNFLKSYSKGIICKITLDNNESFEVSRRKKTEILNLLDKKKM